MIFGVVMAALFTSSMWLFRGNPLFLSAAYKQASGITLNMLSYSSFNFILATVSIIVYTLLCKYLFRADVSALKNIDLAFIKAESSTMTSKQKLLLASFIGMIGTIMSVGFLPKSWAITTALSSIGNSGCVALWLTALLIIHMEGKPVLDFREMSRGIMWDVYFLSGAVLSVAGLMLGEGMGIKESLIAVVGPVLTGQGPVIFTILVVVISTVLTNFIANTVVGLLFVPIIYSCAVQMGMNGTPALVLMLVCIHLAIITPGASPFAAMLFGNSEWVEPKDIYRYGSVAVLLILAVLLVIGIPLSNILF